MDSDKLYQSLLNASFRFVSYRPRSKKEIVDFLKKKLIKWKKEGGETLDKVIERLVELGYIDDEKFALWWVDQRTRFRPKGNSIIELELRQKGIDKNIISAALENRDVVAAAKRALKNKPFDYDYLARRGFDADAIKKVQ